MKQIVCMFMLIILIINFLGYMVLSKKMDKVITAIEDSDSNIIAHIHAPEPIEITKREKVE